MDLDLSGSIGLADTNRQLAQFGYPCDGEITRYTYDGNGTLLKRVHYTTSQLTATPDLSTVYIGGVYEKSFGASGATTGSRKYYAALGRTIAVRDVPAGGGAGTLSYLLADHLGSTVEALDAAGNTLPGSEIRYWPYGGTRAGGVTQTDKLYTGQQQEPGVDPAMGLYNYRARFYSTVLGRFVSADPLGSGTDKYMYVGGNPLNTIDPSGLTALIACGTTQSCENGADVGNYRELIQQEWRREGRYPGADQAFLDWIFDSWLIPALGDGFNGQRSADVFGLVFMDTGGYFENGKDYLFGAGDVGPFVRANDTYFGANGADLWAGYSFGGIVVWSALNRSFNAGRDLPIGAILLQPAIGTQRSYPPAYRGFFGGFDPALLRAVNIVTINDP